MASDSHALLGVVLQRLSYLERNRKQQTESYTFECMTAHVDSFIYAYLDKVFFQMLQAQSAIYQTTTRRT